MLVLTVEGAETALGAVTVNGVAHGGPGSDDSHAGGSGGPV